MAHQKHKYAKAMPLGRKIALVLVAAVLICGTVWGVAAKYIQKTTTDSLVKAPEFYFTSDFLVEGGESYELNPGTTYVTFVLRNHEDTLRYSPGTVAYSVTVDGGTFVQGNPEPVRLVQGTIPETGDVTITLYGLVNGGTYNVTAVGECGYQKTLTATFHVKEGNTDAYKYVDNSNGAYVLLTVWTVDNGGQVSITFPNGLIPDATDPVLSGIRNYNGSYQGGTYTLNTLEANSSYTYRFFKDSAYAGGEFTVTVGGSVAETKLPE